MKYGGMLEWAAEMRRTRTRMAASVLYLCKYGSMLEWAAEIRRMAA